MQSSLESIKSKIRALAEDFLKSDFEVFVYTNSTIFTLAQSNIESILKVLVNGVELESGQYEYDEDTNKIEITMPSGEELQSDDNIEVDYTSYKYSNSELNGYIRGALAWISIFSTTCRDYEIEEGVNEDIYPTVDNRTGDLISVVASIMINPDYTEYRLPNLTVKYYQKLPKEQKIEQLVKRFNYGSCVTDIIV